MIHETGLARGISAAIVAVVLAACAAPARRSTELPPIPARDGELSIDVVYPRDSAFIAARDSNFIFGSVGNGEARLTIDGREVRVEPNGAFLAWLPVPPGDSLARYELTASLGGRQLRATRVVRLPPPAAPLYSDSLAVDRASVTPRGAWWVQPGEVVPVGVNASPGADVRLLLPGGRAVALREVPGPQERPAGIHALAETTSGGGTGIYRGEWAAVSPLGRGVLIPELPAVSVDLAGVTPLCAPPTDGGPPTDTTADPGAAAIPAECALLEVARAGDTVRTPLPLDLWVMPGAGGTVELREEPGSAGRDGYVVGRAGPDATTLWLWSDGVRARVTGRRDGQVRLALDHQTEAWVGLDEVVPLPATPLPARAAVGTVSLEGRPDRVMVRIETSDPIPYYVNEDDERLSLILYGAYANTDWLRYGPTDEFVRGARWEQVGDDRYVLHLDLGGRPWGYRVRYVDGGLLLEIRKPPQLDAHRPLAGLRVVVDPGHPPGGATGPTGLYEADANLAIAFRLQRLLEAEGAHVILTRADRGAVRLYDRTQLAELLDAHVLISIHNNALPDGVNPFENHGTSVYYFHRQSLDLALALQRGLLDTMGLADLGIGRASLALARTTWMPAALTEGAFLMIPAQEVGLRDPAFQQAYARGVLEGLRAFVLGRID